jgi:PAT family acetyl-CoA transporter-like MFS transporter 1
MLDASPSSAPASLSVSNNEFFDLARRGGSINPFRRAPSSLNSFQDMEANPGDKDDSYNYALLIALYTLQGIPIGLSASIPFLIQQKVKLVAEAAASSSASTAASAAAETVANVAANIASSKSHADIAKIAYNAQAIFALCSWPFSLKLLWAPIVDSIFWSKFGRRKSWLVPVQMLAGFIMIGGSNYVEEQLGLSDPVAAAGATAAAVGAFDVKGVTAFFFILYFLMATQDIAVDGWALTMLSKKNRGKGPVCNSIGQNLGYFMAFVGFLALNDPGSSDKLWRPLFGLKPDPTKGLVSLGGFIKFMGMIMIALTTFVAIFKKEDGTGSGTKPIDANANANANDDKDKDNGVMNIFQQKLKQSTKATADDDDAEMDASEIGLRETYHRLWEVCKLPAVRWLFIILLTNRLPTALSDKVKFLKAVEFGMSKQTTALLAPTIILPLGIAVPIIATKVFKGHPLKQFMTAYKLRVTLVPLLDVLMLLAVRAFHASTDKSSSAIFWAAVIGSTALFSIVDSMQFNAQMVFFAHRVDPAIGGTYMTLLNTAANLGSTWPASIVMYMVGQLSVSPTCSMMDGVEKCEGGVEAYFPLQLVLSILGVTWIYFMGNKVMQLAGLPDDAWRTHLSEDEDEEDIEQNKRGKRRGKKGM